MKRFKKYYTYYLVGLFCYLLGFYQTNTNRFPATELAKLKDHLFGKTEANVSFFEKIFNDQLNLPYRFLNNYSAPFYKENDSKALDLSDYKEITNLKFRTNHSKILYQISPEALQGDRFFFGAFDLKENIHAVLHMNHNGEIKRVWKVTQNDLSWKHNRDTNIIPHGLYIEKDGSIIVSYNEGQSITKYDYCGKKLWQTKGNFHHSIEKDRDGNIWTWRFNYKEVKSEIVQIDSKTGNEIKSFNILDIYKANPETDILGTRQWLGKEWMQDPWHGNDIEPLINYEYFPEFSPKSLLLSFRSLNLLMIIDSESLEILWWRQGLTRKQHDPDWLNNGTISVFDNNINRGYSKIMNISPIDMKVQRTLEGKDYHFYTSRQGNHQTLADGHIFITSSLQGRAFEVDAAGNVVFDFHNIYKQQRFMLGDAQFFPEGYLNLPSDCK